MEHVARSQGVHHLHGRHLHRLRARVASRVAGHVAEDLDGSPAVRLGDEPRAHPPDVRQYVPAAVRDREVRGQDRDVDQRQECFQTRLPRTAVEQYGTPRRRASAAHATARSR